jgi:hypothetical protein
MEKMDNELRDILGRAKDLLFIVPPIQPKAPPIYYVTPSHRCGSGFIVKMSISGQQHTLADGIIDLEIACRFADMASLRFKKFRRNLKWNFSEAQAIADTRNDEENGGQLANFLLARLHNRLEEAGQLKEIHIDRSGPAPAIPVRRTVESRLATLEQTLSHLEKRVASIERVIVSMTSSKDEQQQISKPAPDPWCAKPT